MRATLTLELFGEANDADPGVPEADLSRFPREVVAVPGEPVSIGRSPAATLCAPADPQLAGVHARVVCYEDACRVFDMSGSGVTVDGARVSEALLADGSRIEAGRTVVTARLAPDEGDPQWAAQWAPAFEDAPAAARTAAAPVLRETRDPLYAIIDNGRDRDQVGWTWATRSGDPMAPVPADADEQDYAYAAPHLVRMPPESPLLPKLLEATFGAGSTVFLTSRRPFADVLAFLRDLTEATLPDGTAALFRFYDPLVLTRLLSAPGVDATPYFGPVTAWFAEDADLAPGADAWASDAEDEDPEADVRSDETAPPAAPRRLSEYRPRRVRLLAPPGTAAAPPREVVRVVAVAHRLDAEGAG